MVDLTTTNVLLGILAAVAVLQMTGMIIGGVIAWRTFNRTMERIDALEERVQNAVSPLAVRAHAIMDGVDRVLARVDNGTEKLDHALAVTSHGAQIAMTAVNGNVQRTAALAAALASGGRAAIRAWRSRGNSDRATNRAAQAAQSNPDPLAGPAIVEVRPASPSPYINHHNTEESHVSI